jgi:predicted anti-sigma-YlaC factor YlaD
MYRACPVLAACLTIALTACSIKKIAVNKLGNALASSGTTFEGDDDPDFVGQALPFSLKLIESLLAESPKHKGLLFAAASGFTEYTYAFVDELADETAAESVDKSQYLRGRARRLYLRARRYGLRGLDATYPGIGAALDTGARTSALAKLRKQDVPLLYWTAAAHGLAISASKGDPEMIAQLPVVEAMIARVVELDESWGEGSVQDFLINLESVRTGARPEEKQERMRRYFERAQQLSKGTHASTFVGYAENACVPAQNRVAFQQMIEKALAIDPDKKVESRLANLVAQRRARWLQGRVDELFLEPAATARP